MTGLPRRVATAVPPVRRLVDQRDRLLRDRQALRAERRRLLAEIAALHAREPADAGANLGYLFFLSYGRSGTTLLQGILNAVPGVLIRGENGDALRGLYDFHRTAATWRDKKQQPQPLPVEHPWWGIDGYPDDLAYAQIRALVLATLIRPGPDARLVGFKEIRWANRTDLADYVAFVRRVFPGARFLLNTRNHADVAKSKWWARDPDALAKLAVLEQRLREVAGGLGADAYHVHYDDYRDDPEALRGLHDWLGLPFDAEAIRTVQARPHSY